MEGTSEARKRENLLPARFISQTDSNFVSSPIVTPEPTILKIPLDFKTMTYVKRNSIVPTRYEDLCKEGVTRYRTYYCVYRRKSCIELKLL